MLAFFFILIFTITITSIIYPLLSNSNKQIFEEHHKIHEELYELEILENEFNLGLINKDQYFKEQKIIKNVKN